MESLPSKDARSGQVKTSTEVKPYHYVGSGLPNVYLVGVQYEMDESTGLQSADIPCVPALLAAIGKVLVGKKTPLRADEVRFLRKRLRVQSKLFAELVGISSEQYSRLENGAVGVSRSVERAIRLLYAALAELPAGDSQQVAKTIWTAELSADERIVACRDEQNHWIVLTRAA